MSGLTRTKREQRIERDDGDPETTVYIMARRRTQNLIYHSDAECSRLKRAGPFSEWTRERAQAAGKAPCSYCVLDDIDTGGTRSVECPFCDDDLGSLPAHLRKCDEAGTVAEVDGA